MAIYIYSSCVKVSAYFNTATNHHPVEDKGKGTLIGGDATAPLRTNAVMAQASYIFHITDKLFVLSLGLRAGLSKGYVWGQSLNVIFKGNTV